MAIQRVFLGQERAALPAAVDWLLTRYAAGSLADLRQVIVVVPGSRSGRRLLEILVAAARTRDLCLTPPRIETVGALPEQLYRPKRPFATELVQRLVWAETLSAAEPASLAPVIPHLPAYRDWTGWMSYGDLLRQQHIELAAEGLDFSDVAARLSTDEGLAESRRWQALRQVQQAYLDRLDALELWDAQTARLKAVEFRECQTDRDIVLIGAVDLNVALRQMLDQITDRVTALIFAPQNWESRFDSHGCLIPAEWEQIALPIQTAQLELVEGPADQAEAVARQMAALDGRFRADEIVIGVPDEALIPDLERCLASAGVTARWGPGQAYQDTPPVRLLDAVADFLEQQYFDSFAALVRHPDVSEWLLHQRLPLGWLEHVDQYQNHHLPLRLSNEALGSDEEQESWLQVGSAVQRLLGNLTGPERQLVEWSDDTWRVLSEVYGHRVLHTEVAADRVTHAVCSRVLEALRTIVRIPVAVMPRVPAPQAIRWLLDEMRRDAVPAPLSVDSVELLGWLELPLDDAPVLIVTSFNEGFVPQSLNSDLFLPNALRQRLGLLDNSRRYARDAYAVCVLPVSRACLRWIVGRRNHDGDPLAPSRLLFACDRETLAVRARQLFPSPDKLPRQPHGTSPTADERRLVVPQPKPLSEPITKLRVTAFRDYLACPYRFYLKHVARLESASDSLAEMDGANFGSLAHEVMKRFGSGAHRHSTDPADIRDALERELDQCACEAFGLDPLAAVFVQIEQLRWRLRAFAERQAAWSEQGWRIEFVEASPDEDSRAVLEVDGKPFELTGRMDRIDVHCVTGERVILDYKTSDAGLTPLQTHRKGDRWTDLQLPLYRHLAAALKLDGPLRMGYVLLPKNTTATGFSLASWTAEELATADECARQVVRGIRREQFFPPAEPPPPFSEELGPICQDGVLDR